MEKASIINLNFERNTSDLENLLSKQRDRNEKRGIGFISNQDNTEFGKSSMAQERKVEERPRRKACNLGHTSEKKDKLVIQQGWGMKPRWTK